MAVTLSSARLCCLCTLPVRYQTHMYRSWGTDVQEPIQALLQQYSVEWACSLCHLGFDVTVNSAQNLLRRISSGRFICDSRAIKVDLVTSPIMESENISFASSATSVGVAGVPASVLLHIRRSVNGAAQDQHCCCTYDRYWSRCIHP
jgi:hypothetical protein